MATSNKNTILISRTDSIGDVVLTLPLAGYLKTHYPGTSIIFLGQTYTKPVIDACEYIDAFADWTQISALENTEQLSVFRSLKADVILHVFPVREIASLAKKAGIPKRIGTTNRHYHWLYCNRLIRLSRRHSPLHEAQLNFGLLRGLGIKYIPHHEEVCELYGLTKTMGLPEEFSSVLDKTRVNLVLHPKSKGSAREWGAKNFAALAGMLPAEKYRIFITGTDAEGKLLDKEGFFDMAPMVMNLTGRLNLYQLIAFISLSDGVIAASTGPLHLAAALGRIAIGIYPPIKPMHPGRWRPIGRNATCLVADKTCNDCRNGSPCHCMQEISPEAVYEKLLFLLNKTFSH